MTDHTFPATGTPSRGWRITLWGALGALLALPAIAMQFTAEVRWTPEDFLVAAILLLALGLGSELAMRIGRSRAQKLGMIIATLAAFLTIWANGAVGIIANKSEPINLGFYALVLAGLFASLVAWFRPAAMRIITGAIALGQIALGFAALATMPGHAVEWGALAVFAALWGAAAICFHKAVRA